jgi:hypothetical protein
MSTKWKFEKILAHGRRDDAYFASPNFDHPLSLERVGSEKLMGSCPQKAISISTCNPEFQNIAAGTLGCLGRTTSSTGEIIHQDLIFNTEFLRIEREPIHQRREQSWGLTEIY